jgi:hypothetical protein
VHLFLFVFCLCLFVVRRDSPLVTTFGLIPLSQEHHIHFTQKRLETTARIIMHAVVGLHNEHATSRGGGMKT